MIVPRSETIKNSPIFFGEFFYLPKPTNLYLTIWGKEGYNLLMSKLECRDVSIKYFGYDESVAGFSASFSDGVNVVFGAQGSGKTTLLKALAGLIESSGEILFDGASVRDIPLKDRDFQLVFDDLGLFSRHSVLYNLEYPLKKRGIPKEKRRDAVYQAAKLFGLDVMIEAPVYRLTEWHKVALALCRVYLRKAKVVFIDNVFSRLDVCARKQAFLEFMPLLSDRGIVVFATDEVAEAAALSEEIYFLNAGYLLQKGSLREIMEKPSCVAAFSAFQEYPSVLTAELGEDEISVGNAVAEFKSPVSDVYIGKSVLAGFLPFDFVLSEDGFEAKVLARLFSAEIPLYVLETEQGRVFAAIKEKLSIGEKVKLGIVRARFLFDLTNERCIMRSQNEKSN